MIGLPHTDADELHQEMHETFVYSPAAVPRNIIVACEDLSHTHFATINKKRGENKRSCCRSSRLDFESIWDALRDPIRRLMQNHWSITYLKAYAPCRDGTSLFGKAKGSCFQGDLRFWLSLQFQTVITKYTAQGRRGRSILYLGRHISELRLLAPPAQVTDLHIAAIEIQC